MNRPRLGEKLLNVLSWLGLSALVAAGGASLGAFRVAWVRTDSTGFYLYEEGRACVERILLLIPFFGNWLNAYWDQSWLNPFTSYVPGIVGGGFLSVCVWFGLSMGAAWQNALLFAPAMRGFATRFTPLLLYIPLAASQPQFQKGYFHLALLLPFAFVAFNLASHFRETQSKALPAKPGSPGASGTWDFLPLTMVCIVSIVRFLDWSEIAILRHDNFHSLGHDMALMANTLTNFVRGDGLESSLLSVRSSFLGHHFSPILILISPIYFFSANPETLILIQSAALAFATIPLYAMGRRCIGSAWAGATLAMAYLYFPGLTEGAYYDFHIICFAPILLFWLGYAVRRTDRNWYWIPTILLFTVQENVIIYVFAFGLYLLFNRETRKQGQRITGASLAAIILVFTVFMPLFGPEESEGYGFANRYEDFVPKDPSESPGIGQLIGGILTNPGMALHKVFTPEARSIYLRYWSGVLFAPLWNPLALILLFPILENTLSSDGMLRVWGNHYSFGPIALSCLAIVGAFRFWSRYPRFRNVCVPLSFLILFSSMFWGMRRSPLPYSVFRMDQHYSSQVEPPSMKDTLLAEIPYGSTVAAQTHLLPHITFQKDLYLIPPGLRPYPYENHEPVDSLKKTDLLIPDTPWPDYIAYNPKKEGHYWYNLWFYDSDYVTETRAWLEWVIDSGRYTQSFPREGMDPESIPSLVVLKRLDAEE